MNASDHRSAIIRYWDSAAARYLDLFRDELRDKSFDVDLFQTLANSLGPNARVCDVGCGPCAHVTRLLADAGLAIVGVDLSPVCIALAHREQPSLDLRVMDAAALEFPASSFDGLVVYYVLHYIPKHCWPQVCAEFARVLRPGGLVFVVMKSGDGEVWLPDPMGGDIDTFWAASSQNELEAIVAFAGFRLIEARTRPPLPTEIALDRVYLLAECAKPT
jgi:ubiquinone/menaquinone biosynthesis C-methylase UbiE